MNIMRSFLMASLMSAGIFASTDTDIVKDFSDLMRGARNPKEVFQKGASLSIPLVVKCFMVGCGPCRDTEKGYREMAQDYKDRARFITLDVIKYEEFAKEFGIQRVPTFLIFAQGKKLGTIKGSGRMKEIRGILNKYLATQTSANS